MTSIPPRTIPLTCVEDGRSHQVTDEAMTAGMRAHTGRYRAMCGRTVTATLMLDPRVVPARAAKCRPHGQAAGTVRAGWAATAGTGFSGGCSHGA